jgi:hypothetical protein
MNTNLQQSSWILPVTKFFKPFGIKKDEIDKRSFLKLSFANKGLELQSLILVSSSFPFFYGEVLLGLDC